MSISKPKIVMVGGGSANWEPRLTNDLLLTPALEAREIVLLDIDITAADLPCPVNNLVRQHCENQDMIVDAALNGDRKRAFDALYNDPLCSHMTYPEITGIGERLLKAHEEYVPF